MGIDKFNIQINTTNPAGDPVSYTITNSYTGGNTDINIGDNYNFMKDYLEDGIIDKSEQEEGPFQQFLGALGTLGLDINQIEILYGNDVGNLGQATIDQADTEGDEPQLTDIQENFDNAYAQQAAGAEQPTQTQDLSDVEGGGRE